MLFLLSAAPLGVGCIITGGDDTDTGVSTMSPTTDTPGTTTEAPGTETTPGETTVEPVSTDDRAETTETPSDTTMTPEDTTAGVEIPAFCEAYGAAIEACFAGYGDMNAQICADLIPVYYEPYGPECVAAYEDWVVCLTGLNCKALEMDEPPGCEAEVMAIDTACAKK